MIIISGRIYVAFDKLLLSLSSIFLDFGSINYLKLKTKLNIYVVIVMLNHLMHT